MQYVVGFSIGLCATAYLSGRLIDLYAQPRDWPSLFGTSWQRKQTLHISLTRNFLPAKILNLVHFDALLLFK